MKAKKIDSLTSLRFFAASAIVLGHGWHLFEPLNIAHRLALVQAVSFFFTLSGFILAFTYDGRLGDRTSLRHYYGARIARIVPTHLLTALTALVLVIGASASAPIVLTNLLLLQAWVPSIKYFFSLNGPAWSISVEAFFYAIFPVLMWRLSSTWHWKLIITIAVAFGMIACATGRSAEFSLWTGNIAPITRLPEFVFGIVAFKFYRDVQMKESVRLSSYAFTMIEGICLTLIVVSMYLGANAATEISSHHPAYEAVAQWLLSGAGSPIAALTVFVFAQQKGMFSRMLCTPTLVYLGEASFALYMVHQIVLRIFVERLSPASTLQHVGLWTLYIITSMALASMIHSLYENPIRKFLTNTLRTGRLASARISHDDQRTTEKERAARPN